MRSIFNIVLLLLPFACLGQINTNYVYKQVLLNIEKDANLINAQYVLSDSLYDLSRDTFCEYFDQNSVEYKSLMRHYETQLSRYYITGDWNIKGMYSECLYNLKQDESVNDITNVLFLSPIEDNFIVAELVAFPQTKAKSNLSYESVAMFTTAECYLFEVLDDNTINLITKHEFIFD